MEHLGIALSEMGCDAFVAAAMRLAHERHAMFSQPGALEFVQAEAQRLAASTPVPQAAAAGQDAATAVAPASTGGEGAASAAPAPEAQEQPQAPPEQQQQEQAAAEPEQAAGEPEQEGEAEPKDLKPNASNGADLDRYSWAQTLAECTASFPVPPGTRGRDCAVAISRTSLSVGLKGQPPILAGELYAAVKPDDCCWNVVDGRVLEVTLAKASGMEWWRAVVRGEPEIDVQRVEPESSKLEDLDPDMRATVERMMHDQRQKALGLPTSEEQEKAAALRRFMAAHPEMDFSNAKVL